MNKNSKMLFKNIKIFYIILTLIMIPTNSIEKKEKSLMNIEKKSIFTFKILTKNDWPLIINWLKEKHVNQWWPVPKEDENFEDFLMQLRSKDTIGYLIMFNEIPIGFIQYYYIDQTKEKTGAFYPKLPKNTIGTDQFIGDLNYIGKGYGTILIKEFIHFIAKLKPDITTVIVDPEPNNYPAIKCYEKVGFKQIGNFETAFGPALLMQYDIK